MELFSSKFNTTIDITTVICIVYSILRKYTKLLKLFNLSQNNILSLQVKGQLLFLVEVKSQRLFFQFDHFDQGRRLEYSNYPVQMCHPLATEVILPPAVALIATEGILPPTK